MLVNSVLLFASQVTPSSPSLQLLKRGLLSCEQTYGPESKQCGPPDSGFCYNPSLGQSCCETDYAFCNEGAYCAPVPGYCCMDGESLEDCAEAAGFEIPVDYTPTAIPVAEETNTPETTAVSEASSITGLSAFPIDTPAATASAGRLGPIPEDGKSTFLPFPSPSETVLPGRLDSSGGPVVSPLGSLRGNGTGPAVVTISAATTQVGLRKGVLLTIALGMAVVVVGVV